jgi:hypothetical protein
MCCAYSVQQFQFEISNIQLILCIETNQNTIYTSSLSLNKLYSKRISKSDFYPDSSLNIYIHIMNKYHSDPHVKISYLIALFCIPSVHTVPVLFRTEMRMSKLFVRSTLKYIRELQVKYEVMI